MSTIKDKLHQVLSRIHDLEKIERHYSELEQEFKTANNELRRLDSHLNESYKDIEKLEKLSIKGLFYKVLGSKEEQIEKERQDYLQVALKIKEQEKKIELLNYELGVLDRKTDELPGLRKQLDQLKVKRQDEILWSRTDESLKLKNILKAQDSIFLKIKEIKEARNEGEACIKDLNAMIGHLNKAKDWGNWDMMGKGRMADYYKRDAMDRAKDIAYHAQRSLNRFQRELRDVNRQEYDFDIQIENVGGFLDFFFDNLISDWIVQQKIRNSLMNVRGIKNDVKQICQSLDDHMSEFESRFNDLDNEKDMLITS